MRSVMLINCMRSLVIQSTMRLKILKPAGDAVGAPHSTGATSASATFPFAEFMCVPLPSDAQTGYEALKSFRPQSFFTQLYQGLAACTLRLRSGLRRIVVFYVVIQDIDEFSNDAIALESPRSE